MPYVDFSFLGKWGLCYHSVLLVQPALASSSSTRISVATGGSNEALSGGGASISIVGIEKNNVPCNFLDFHPIITLLLLIPSTIPEKYSLDGKTLLHSPSYDINKEVDRISKGYINKKYRIVSILSVVADVSKCTRKKIYVHYDYLVTAVSLWRNYIKVFRKLYIDAKFYADHEYGIYFILKVNFIIVIVIPNTP